jgi:hypothetical protein
MYCRLLGQELQRRERQKVLVRVKLAWVVVKSTVEAGGQKTYSFLPLKTTHYASQHRQNNYLPFLFFYSLVGSEPTLFSSSDFLDLVDEEYSHHYQHLNKQQFRYIIVY